MNYSPAVVVRDLVVRRGRVEVLHGVDAHIPAGQVVGLLGPSGAGKTTLMRTIVGAQRTTSGTVQVFDRPAGHRTLRRELGYMAQSSAIYDDLTVEQNLDYFRRVLGAPKSDVDRIVAEVGLDPVLREELWGLFGRLAARGATLLVSSHVMDEARRCDRLLLVRGGRIIADETPDGLLAVTGASDHDDAFLKLVERDAAARKGAA